MSIAEILAQMDAVAQQQIASVINRPDAIARCRKLAIAVMDDVIEDDRVPAVLREGLPVLDRACMGSLICAGLQTILNAAARKESPE